MNVYDPSPTDINEWLLTGDWKWPEQDWDLYVINGHNDELIFQRANDDSGHQHAFFVHCLYHLVGDFVEWNSDNADIRARIDHLLDAVNDSSHSAVIKWKVETQAVLNGGMPFDLRYWINFLFNRDVEPGI